MAIASTRVSAAHLDFALRVQRAMVPDESGAQTTLCWSPMSVASALGLAACGAAGPTAAELRTVLTGSAGGDLGEHADGLLRAATLDEESGGERPVFAVANTLWAREDIRIVEEFGQRLLSWPNGAIRDAPFTRDPRTARRMINTDVAETTRNLIPELIPEGTVGPSVVAALVNALYLKVAWRHGFPEHATDELPFHGFGGTRDTPTMRITESLGYAHIDGWQVVTIPAAGGAEAVVLLPDGDLAAAERRLDGRTLASLSAAPTSTRVQLFLPRLHVTTKSPLAAVLRTLGAATMFTPDADFSALSPDPLYVSDVLHEAVLKADEQGLEGAAATAMMVKLAAFAREPDPVTVRADRPFLLLVRHRDTGVLYFSLRVLDA